MCFPVLQWLLLQRNPRMEGPRWAACDALVVLATARPRLIQTQQADNNVTYSVHEAAACTVQLQWVPLPCHCLAAPLVARSVCFRGAHATWLQVLYQNPLAEGAPADAVTGLAVTGQERHTDGAVRRGATLVECWLVMELCNMGTLQVGTTGHDSDRGQAPTHAAGA